MYSKRVSIRDVARHAGVAPITVSNVLNRHADRYSEATAKRVMQALQELDYIPVRFGMQNRQTKTHTLGVVFVQSLMQSVGFRTFQGMCDRCRERDYNLTIVLRSGPDWLHPEKAAQFLDRNCDGFIFVGEGDPKLIALLIRHGLPIVECYDADGVSGAGSVLPDSAAAMRMAVERVLAQGHQRIAHLGGPVWNAEARQRRESFQQTMRDYGLTGCADFVVQGDVWGSENISIRPLPETIPLIESVLAFAPTAVVCADDLLALDLWAVAQGKGWRIPEDLSITGMDNIKEGDLRGLTSVDGAFEQVGRTAVDQLLARIEGAEQSEVTLVPVTLIERGSVAPPRSAI